MNEAAGMQSMLLMHTCPGPGLDAQAMQLPAAMQQGQQATGHMAEQPSLQPHTSLQRQHSATSAAMTTPHAPQNQAQHASAAPVLIGFDVKPTASGSNIHHHHHQQQQQQQQAHAGTQPLPIPKDQQGTSTSSAASAADHTAGSSSTLQPGRVLTKPGIGTRNGGADNDTSDLVLTVGDALVNSSGSSYLVKDMLGQGTFGQVALCWSETLGRDVAVKVSCVASGAAGPLRL
jgi:hypothetical protein